MSDDVTVSEVADPAMQSEDVVIGGDTYDLQQQGKQHLRAMVRELVSRNALLESSVTELRSEVDRLDANCTRAVQVARDLRVEKDEIMATVTETVQRLWFDCSDAEQLGRDLGIKPPPQDFDYTVTLTISGRVREFEGDEDELRDRLNDSSNWTGYFDLDGADDTIDCVCVDELDGA